MAIDLLTKHIQRQLQERKMQSRWDMARICPPQELPSNVVVLEETKQIKACHLSSRVKICRRFVLPQEAMVHQGTLSYLPFIGVSCIC